MRVVSLVPSATETLLAWGIEPVACTRFCEQPGLVHVGGTKDPHLDAIVDLRPDLVVVDEEENRKDDADALAAEGLALFVFAVRSLRDAVEQCEALAAAVGIDTPAEGIEPVGLSLPEPPPPADRTAFVPIWKRPWMGLGAGTYGTDVLARLGVANALAAEPGRYPEVDLDSVHADLVVAPSEPYPFAERHRAELERVAPVVFVDGRDLFWWGARTPGAVERLRVQLDRRAR